MNRYFSGLLHGIFVGFVIVLAYEANEHRLQSMQAEYRPPVKVVYDLHPDAEPYTETKRLGPHVMEHRRHLHCPEELNGGGYRNGKFVYHPGR